MLQSKMTIALSSIYDSLINSKIPPNSKQYMSKPVLDEVRLFVAVTVVYNSVVYY